MSRFREGAGFDWLEFLRYAERNASGRSPFIRRLVINRAYYAVFHVARGALRTHGVEATASTFHRQVWSCFQDPRTAPRGCVDEGRDIADMGRELLEQRTRADYDAHATWTGLEVNAIVVAARDAVNRIGALTSR